MHYEKIRSILTQYISADRHTNMTFPAHLHASFEILYVTEGIMNCIISGRNFTVSKGQAAIIFPNTLHGYRTPEKSRDINLIFSSDYVQEFYKRIKNCELANPVFTPDAHLLDIVPSRDNIFEIKGKLYQLCGQALAGTELIPNSDKNDVLMQKIIEYISEKYTEPITLKEMAQSLGYNYYYLSGFINDNFSGGFSDLVNSYRISEALVLLRSSNLSITEVSSECGFGSIRSFNRAFKLIHNVSPKEYIAAHSPEQD